MWAGEDGERDGAHQWAGSHCYVWDGIGPWTHHSGWTHSFGWIAAFAGLVQLQPGNVFLLQSLQTDVYDHYSAIYSLLADRLKKHKTLPVVMPTPRPIGYPVNAVQVWPFCWKIQCLLFRISILEFLIMVYEVAIFYSLAFYKCIKRNHSLSHNYEKKVLSSWNAMCFCKSMLSRVFVHSSLIQSVALKILSSQVLSRPEPINNKFT